MGETIHWKDTAKIRYPRRPSCVEENEDSKDTIVPDSDSSSYSEDDASSTSTELCDEPERFSDFDSDDKFSGTAVKSEIDSVRTTKELKNSINSEKFLTEEILYADEDANKDPEKSKTSNFVNSEETDKEIIAENDEPKTEGNDESADSVGKSKGSDVICSEKCSDFVELKSADNEVVNQFLSDENELFMRLPDSSIKFSETESDIYSNPVFYSEISNAENVISDLQDSETESAKIFTIMNESKIESPTDKYDSDGLEDIKNLGMENVSVYSTNGNDKNREQCKVYEFENISNFNLNTPEEVHKIDEDIVSTSAVSADENLYCFANMKATNTENLLPEIKYGTEFFDVAAIKPSSVESSPEVKESITPDQTVSVSMTLKVQDNLAIDNSSDTSMSQVLVLETNTNFDISPATPMYTFEPVPQKEEASSLALFIPSAEKPETIREPNSTIFKDIIEETVDSEPIQNLDLSPNKYFTKLVDSPDQQETISQNMDKNYKIQNVLNENSDILKGYQLSGHSKGLKEDYVRTNSELTLDDTDKIIDTKAQIKELLEFESVENTTGTSILAAESVSKISSCNEKRSSDFEYFLEEQVKLLKQNNSDNASSPKEEMYSAKSAEEKLRRHKSYEETTTNDMNKSTFHKQTSFDFRFSPIEETPKWMPYYFDNKQVDDFKVVTKNEELCSSTEDTLQEMARNEETISTSNLVETPVIEGPLKENVMKYETTDWSLQRFEAESFKQHEISKTDTKLADLYSKTLNISQETGKNEVTKMDINSTYTYMKEETYEEHSIKYDTRNWAPLNFGDKESKQLENNNVQTKLDNIYSDNLIADDAQNPIKIDVNLAETPVKEEICKELVVKQPSIDLLSVDDSRLEAGRRNSARALKIIQENSLILHRILQHSKSSDKEDSEDELSRSPISRTFKSESLLSREDRTDEDRSSRDGEDLESCTEISLSPAILEEECEIHIHKTREELENKTIDESINGRYSDVSHARIDSFSSFTHAEQHDENVSSLSDKSSNIFTFEIEDANTNDQIETRFSFRSNEDPSKFSTKYNEQEAEDKSTHERSYNRTISSSNKEDSFETFSHSKKELSSIHLERETINKTSNHEKLERRYSSWHEETSPVQPSLSNKQYSSSFSFRSPEEEKPNLKLYGSFSRSIDPEQTSSYLEKYPDKAKPDIKNNSSNYSLEKYEQPSYAARIKEESDAKPDSRLNSSVVLTRGTSDYLSSSRISDEETVDNNVYSTDKFKSSAQSHSYSKSYSDFQYNRNRLSMDLSSAPVPKEYSPEISPPKHLSCLQFTTFQTDIPCTSKTLQFSPICSKAKTNISPATASPTSSNNKYIASFNLPTLSPPKRSVKSPLSPARSFNPFPVQPTTRQPKDVGVRLGLYKDLSPLKSPAK